MEINSEKMSTEIESMIYEQPSIKKYGTMKQLTHSVEGSAGDVQGLGGSRSIDRTGSINNAAIVDFQPENTNNTLID